MTFDGGFSKPFLSESWISLLVGGTPKNERIHQCIIITVGSLSRHNCPIQRNTGMVGCRLLPVGTRLLLRVCGCEGMALDDKSTFTHWIVCGGTHVQHRPFDCLQHRLQFLLTGEGRTSLCSSMGYIQTGRYVRQLTISSVGQKNEAKKK